MMNAALIGGLTIGICTYNRKTLLESVARSLYEVEGIDDVNIRIYDDASTEFDEKFLRSIFPTATSITVNEHNMGADYNTSRMYEEFLSSKDMWLLNADSDLIYRKDILDQIERLVNSIDGFVSLLNVPSHKVIEEDKKIGIVYKEHVGAAGCLFRRDILQQIVDAKIMDHAVHIDFGFSEFLISKGHKIACCKKSLVQHVGVNGYNCSGIVFDYGYGFEVDSLINAKIIENAFECYVESINEYKLSKEYKLSFFVTRVRRFLKNKILKR